MTETSILPVSSDEGQPPSYDSQPPDGDGVAGANRKKLLIAGGVVGGIVVAVAAFLLLHGGSSSSSASTAAVPRGTPPASAPAAHRNTGTTKTVTSLPKKAHAQAGRNPFTPLYVAPVDGGTAVGGTTTVASTPAPSAGATAPVTAPTPAPTPTTSAPTSGGLGSPTYLELLSTKGTHSATFRVGYPHHKFKRYDVQAPSAHSSTGTVFDTEFALISVKDGVATVQVGDSAPFQLTAGLARSA